MEEKKLERNTVSSSDKEVWQVTSDGGIGTHVLFGAPLFVTQLMSLWCAPPPKGKNPSLYQSRRANLVVAVLVRAWIYVIAV